MDSEIIFDTRMFDFSAFYERMAEELPPDCKVCEVGVADGHSALYLALQLHRMGKNFTLYMVDNMDYGGFEQMKKIYENIIKTGIGRKIEVLPYDSIEAASKFNDGFLDLVFIDSSHTYEATKKEIPAWYSKVKDLGILAGHDYDGHEGVRRAVDETIPTAIVRDDIPDREFEPEVFLHDERTVNGCGVWWCKKDFYKKLKL